MPQDKTIKCKDCGQEFTFTVGESEFYSQKKLAEPEYCLICRGKYKAMQNDAAKFGKGGVKILNSRK